MQRSTCVSCVLVCFADESEIIRVIGRWGGLEEKRKRERKERIHEKSNYTTFALPLAPFCGQFLLRTRIISRASA